MRSNPVVALLLSAILIASLASGCGSKTMEQPGANPAETAETRPHANEDPDKDTGHSGATAGGESANSGKPSSDTTNQSETGQNRPSEGQEVPGKKELEISSNDESSGTQALTPPDQPAHGLMKGKLQLMGISLDHTREHVIGKHGTPMETFVMEHEIDPLTVYRYAGFQIGFDRTGRVEFIDVSSPEVDPGLSGIRLGTHVETCVAVLGEPQTQTEYVLNYITETAIMKMDVDPNTKQINSIKLFPAEP